MGRKKLEEPEVIEVTDIISEHFVENGEPKVKKTFLCGEIILKTEVFND